MSNQFVGETPKKSMSTGKKWFIGCGGCLVFIGLIAAIIVGLSMWGWNTAVQTSNQSVKALLGQSFSGSDYTAVAWPFKNGKVDKMAMLIANDKETIVFAAQLNLTPTESAMLANLKPEHADMLTKLAKQFTVNSQNTSQHSKIEDLSLQAIQHTMLSNHKSYTTVYATLKQSKQGNTSFSPIATALIPEADNKSVVLVGFSPTGTSESEDKEKFLEVQKSLDARLKKLIEDSELDDQLQSGQS